MIYILMLPNSLIKMDKSYLYIFFGILAIAMGIGNDQGEIIPSWAKLSIGFVAIVYGIYLKYGLKKADGLESDLTTKKRTERKNSRPSYIYLTLGVLLLSISKYLINRNDYLLDFWTVIVGISGLVICAYGLNMFFRERREKKESGSIE